VCRVLRRDSLLKKVTEGKSKEDPGQMSLDWLTKKETIRLMTT